MLEPPSALLLKTLAALKLCTPRDLRRCRAVVKRVTRDLPTFDSVWIDALVQRRRLTPFQAECLEAGRAEQLAIGPCLLLERLGRTAFAETFLARQREAHDVCVLKLTSIAAEQLAALRGRLEQLTEIHRLGIHPGIIGPQAWQQIAWPTANDLRLVSISRHVRGPHLAELLIRRGRFPIPVVMELGRELLAALAALESHRLAHGDVSLTNVRIAPSGQAVLVDAGVVTALRPEFSFHTVLSAERYDGLAPERIAGHPPSSASDLYSLGCLLWHLLAGRPPFLAGDPLAKLAAHQTKPVPDVRECVPDTPDKLANMLLRWTSLNPASRPRSCAEAAKEFGSANRGGRRLIARFRGEFDRSLPRIDRPAERSGWPIVAASLLVLAGAAVPLSNSQTRDTLMSWIRPKLVTASSERIVPAVDSASIDEPPCELQPLAKPNATGQIHLPRAGRFTASQISVDGVLELIGDPRGPAEIVVNGESLRLSAERIVLRNVCVVQAEESQAEPLPLIVTECQLLEVSGLRSRVAPRLGSRSRSDRATYEDVQEPAAIAWRPRDPKAHDRTQIQLTDSVFAGTGSAIYLAQPPAELIVTNVLKSGPGEAVQLIDPGQAPWRCLLRQVTLRNNGPWLRSWPRGRNGSVSRLTLTAEGCVWEVADPTTSNAERQSLIAWMSSRLPVNSEASVEWHCSGVFVPPHIDIAAVIDPTDGRRTVVDDSRWNLDGIIATRCEFAGPATSLPSDSELKSSDAPRSSQIQYGFHAKSFDTTRP